MRLQDHGSIALIVPETEDEHQWLKDNCEAEDWQFLSGGLAVEPRLAEAIMEGFGVQGQ